MKYKGDQVNTEEINDIHAYLEKNQLNKKHLEKYNLQFTTFDKLSFYNNCGVWCDKEKINIIPSSQGNYTFQAPNQSKYTCLLEIDRYGNNDYKNIGKTKKLKFSTNTKRLESCGNA